MVTLRDISRDTGISVTQVSRALGRHGDVKERTRQIVEEAATRLGYRPNTVARGLKTGRSGIVAMVVPATIDASAQEIMLEIIMGLSAELSRQGMKFVFHVCQPQDDPADAHESLFRGGGIDGFIVILAVRNDPRVARLMELGIPHVVHGCDHSLQHPGVDVDNVAVGQALAGHLAGLGHRRVLFMNGPRELLFAVDREKGVQAAFAKAGLPPVKVTYNEMTAARGRAEARAALVGPRRATAIVAGNTMIAKGIYETAEELGLRIPQHLSVLAHDDGLRHYDASRFVPALGCTRATLHDAWVTMANLLGEAIRSGPADVGKTALPFTFNARESAAVVPGFAHPPAG